MGFRKIITEMIGLIVIAITGIGIFTAVPLYAQGAPCELVNNQERMLVFFAPVYANSQIKEILPQGAPYTMLGEHNGYFFIEYADGGRGWIDYHTIILNSRCTELMSLFSEGEWYDYFPTLCFYTTTETLKGYHDPALTISHGGFETVPPGTFLIADREGNAVSLAGTSAMSGAFIEDGHGTFSGHCEGTLRLARVGDNVRLWTEPDTNAGEVIVSLDAAAEVVVLEGPIQGVVADDSSVHGNWYKINYRGSIGWVWENRLIFGRTYTAPLPSNTRANVLADARVWSQPDVTTGEVVTTLLEGARVKIIGQPVEGVVRQDSGVSGIWYPVQMGGTTGWVYGERLEILDGKG